MSRAARAGRAMWVAGAAALALTAGAPAAASAAAGDPDRWHGDGGTTTLSKPGGVQAYGSDVDLLADGGSVATVTVDRRAQLARLTSAGRLHAGFGTGGWVDVFTGPETDSLHTEVLGGGLLGVTGIRVDPVLPDGSWGGITTAVARVRPDGSRDPTWGGGAPVTLPDTFAAVSRVLPDGRVILADMHWVRDPERLVGISSRMRIRRLSATGALDETFDVPVPAPSPADVWIAYDMQAGPAGTFTVTGTQIRIDEEHVSYTQVPFALRLLADGRPDASYGQAGVAYGEPGAGEMVVRHVALPDGSVVAGGTSYVADGGAGTYRLLAVKWTPDGRLDPSFGQGGAVRLRVHPSNSISSQSLVVDANGRFLLAGNWHGWQVSPDTGEWVADESGFVARVNADGSPDLRFGTGGIRTYDLGTNGWFGQIAPGGTGRLLLTGQRDGRSDGEAWRSDSFVSRVSSGDTVFTLPLCVPLLCLSVDQALPVPYRPLSGLDASVSNLVRGMPLLNELLLAGS